MNFLKKLLALGKHAGGSMTERDNLGTRMESVDQVQASMAGAMITGKDRAFAFYRFSSEEAARSALLRLSCIHRATDTGNLISTETLEFGVFQDASDGSEKPWVTFIRAEALPVEVYDEAVESFGKGGGDIIDRKRPDMATARAYKRRSQAKPKGKVTFSHKIDLSQQGGLGTKKIYKATSREAALEFLKSKPVTKDYFYIEVETPEGWCGRDINGIY